MRTRPTFCFVPFDILRMRRKNPARSIDQLVMRVRSRSFFMRAMNSRKAAPVISSMQAIRPAGSPKRSWMRAGWRKFRPSMLTVPHQAE